MTHMRIRCQTWSWDKRHKLVINALNHASFSLSIEIQTWHQFSTFYLVEIYIYAIDNCITLVSIINMFKNFGIWQVGNSLPDKSIVRNWYLVTRNHQRACKWPFCYYLDCPFDWKRNSMDMFYNSLNTGM